MLLDAWSLQALAAAGTAIAGECGRCAPPSHAVPSAHMSTNALHATAFSAKKWGRSRWWRCCCCCTALLASCSDCRLSHGRALSPGSAPGTRGGEGPLLTLLVCRGRAGISLLLVLALCLAVLGLKGQVRRLVDERGATPHPAIFSRRAAGRARCLYTAASACSAFGRAGREAAVKTDRMLPPLSPVGVLRRACLPKDLQTTKEKGAEDRDKQADKHVTQLEAALREAAGAIQRHDKEMKKMIDRLQELESQQKGLEETMKTTNDSLLSPQKSYERDPRLMLATPLKSSSEVREVQEDREKSYLVGASVSQSVDLRAAQMSTLGSDASARSLSQSNTPMGLMPPGTAGAPDKGSKASVMSPIASGGNTADTSPVPGPASVAASLRASADESNESGRTPAYPLGARASSDDSNRSGNKSVGPDLYGENRHASILFAGGPGSNASSHAGPETIMQDDMIVKADIGFSKNASAGSGHSSFWAAMTDNINGMTDNINLRTVPLLSLGQLSGSEDDARAKRQQEIQKEKKRERERSLSRERRYARSQNSQPSSREPTPPRTPGKATPASLSAPSTPTMKGYTPVSSGGGLSARGTPHGHIHTALPSPHGSNTSNTSKSRRQVSSMHGHARLPTFPVADATLSIACTICTPHLDCVY